MVTTQTQLRFSTKLSRVAFWLVVMLLCACGGSGSSTSSGDDPVTNSPPVAVDDGATQTGLPLTIAVLNNDSDPDQDTLTILSVGAASDGAVQIDDNGTPALASDDTIVYTPNQGFLAADQFSYTISDGSANATANVAILASPVPVALPDTATVAPGATSNIDVLANDSDPNNLPLTIVSVGLPGSGVAAPNNNGTPNDPTDDFVTYTPDIGFQGPDSFVYGVSNGVDTVTASVSLNVIADGSQLVTVSGRVSKGPVENAVVQIFGLSPDGQPLESNPIAQTITDNLGNWSAQLPVDSGGLWISAFGGSFVDESDGNPDPTQRRRVVLVPEFSLVGILADGETSLAITPFTTALVRKSQQETQGGNFVDVLANNRSLWANGFGFDLFSTLPVNPDNPDQAQNDEERRYTLALGGSANAMNQIASRLGQPSIDFMILEGFIQDFVDCRLDGEDLSGLVELDFGSGPVSLPIDVNLNTEILRFRNNNFELYGNLITDIDSDVCDVPGALPDTTPPEFVNVPPPFTVAATSPVGIPSSDPSVQSQLLLVTASDNRGGVVTLNNDVPDTLPIGANPVTFVAQDEAGNQNTFVLTITVTDQTPPVIQAPDDLRVTAPVDSAMLGLGSPTVSDNVTPVAELVISNDRPAEFPLGATVVTWTVTDTAGLSASDSQVVTVVDAGSPVLVSPIPDSAAIQETPFQLDVSGNFSDPDQDPLSFQLLGLPLNTGLTIDSATGVIAGTPNNNDVLASPMELVVLASDGVSAASGRFVLTVQDVNDAPVLDLPINDITGSEGQSLSISFFANFSDPDGDSLTFALAGLPQGSGLSIDTVNGVLSGIPNTADVAVSPNTLTLTASDPNGATVSDQFVFNVININDAPTAIVLDSTSVPENSPLASVVGTLTTEDPDVQDSHVYELVAGVGDTDNGQFSIAGDTLRTAAVFDFETQNVFSVRIRSTDNGTPSLSLETQFLISVEDINDVPVITAQVQTLTVPEDSPLLIPLTAVIVDDPDNVFPQDFTLSVQDGVNYSRNANTITPAEDFVGNLTVSVTVNDGQVSSNTFDLTVTVTPVNDPPVITGQQRIATPLNQSVTVSLDQLTIDDPDNVLADLSLSLQDGINYSRSGNTITPDPGFVGVLTVPALVSDLESDGPVTNLAVVVGTADLSLELAFDNPTPAIGEFITLSATVSNLGPEDTSGVEVGLVIGDGYQFASSDGVFNPAMETWTIGDLSQSAQSVLNVTVRIRDAGNFEVYGEITSSAVTDNDSVPGNNSTNEDDDDTAAVDPVGAKVDSDGDGLSDDDEVNVFFTDPSDGDTDNDFVGDGVEVGFGSDPTVPEPPGNVLFVSPTGDDANNGQSGWGDALASNTGLALQLQDGLATAPVYVLYEAGVFEPIQVNNSHVVLVGSVGPQQFLPSQTERTVFDATGASTTVLTVADATNVGINGVDLTGGDIDGNGGGLSISNADVLYSNAAILNNQATGEGGGFFVAADAALTLQDSLVQGNLADENTNLFGGGGGSVRGGLIMKGSVFADNKQFGTGGQPGGGALYVENNAVVDIRDSLFVANESFADGGAVLIQRINAPALFRNNLFVGNKNNNSFGGAFHAVSIDRGNTLTFESNTVVYNQTEPSNNSGGGVDIWISADLVDVRDNIIWFNNDNSDTVDADDNILIHTGSQATVSFNNIQSGPFDGQNGNLSQDPLFTGGFYLQALSPSVDAGSDLAETLGFLAPLTTSLMGEADSNVLDQGFHHPGPGFAAADVAITQETFVCSDNSLVLDVTPSDGLVDLGPGRLLAVDFDAANTVTGVLDSLSDLTPPVLPTGVLAIDRGDGSYRVTVTGLVFAPDTPALLQISIDTQSPLMIPTSDLSELAAQAGC